MQRPIVLPYVKVDQKKVVKKKSQSVVRSTRKKKNVVESDDDGEDKEMRDESPAIERTARKKRSMTVNTGLASAPSHGPRTGEVPYSFADSLNRKADMRPELSFPPPSN